MIRRPPPLDVDYLAADHWLLVAEAYVQAGYPQQVAVAVADAALWPVAITGRRST